MITHSVTSSAPTGGETESRALRIAVVAACPLPWPRGTPIRIYRMAQALAARGHEVHVVTYHLGDEQDDKRVHIHRIADVPSYRHTAPGPTIRKLIQLDPMLVRRLRALHRRLRFDVVHAHHYEGVVVASRAVSGVPIVYDAHTTLAGELPFYPTGLPRWLARSIGRRLDRILPAMADRVVTVSDAIRQILIDEGRIAPENVQMIANGVECELFAVDPPPDRSAGRVIFTGNMARYQRVDLLLDSFAQLHRRRPDVRLMIVTDGSFAPYETQAHALGIRDAIDLRNAPFEQQPQLLATATLAVNPRTQCDGLPQKVLNYMAAGLPIVSFAGAAVHLVDERTALTVPDGDVYAMATAMERLITNPLLARRIGDAARDEVRRDRSWDGVARRVEELYRQLLARPAFTFAGR